MHVLLFHLACADDIRDTDGDGDIDVAESDTDTDADSDTDTDADSGTDSGRIVSIPEGSTGVTYVEIDATEAKGWIYFDFDSPTEVTAEEGWEVALQRFDPMTNGGTSGSGGIEVAKLLDTTLEEVTAIPTDGWVVDDGKTHALGDWYDYDHATHVLTARETVYVLRDPSGAAWKLQFVDYYDDAGNSGYPSFRWAVL